jgi:hypothetical protein
VGLREAAVAGAVVSTDSTGLALVRIPTAIPDVLRHTDQPYLSSMTSDCPQPPLPTRGYRVLCHDAALIDLGAEGMWPMSTQLEWTIKRRW